MPYSWQKFRVWTSKGSSGRRRPVSTDDCWMARGSPGLDIHTTEKKKTKKNFTIYMYLSTINKIHAYVRTCVYPCKWISIGIHRSISFIKKSLITATEPEISSPPPSSPAPTADTPRCSRRSGTTSGSRRKPLLNPSYCTVKCKNSLDKKQNVRAKKNKKNLHRTSGAT